MRELYGLILDSYKFDCYLFHDQGFFFVHFAESEFQCPAEEMF